MVINHHITSQLAEQRATEIRRQAAGACATVAGETRSSRRRRLRRLAHTPLVAVKEIAR